MAGLKLAFSGLTDFNTSKPEELRRDLQREHRDIAAAFSRVEQQAEPIPRVRRLQPRERADFFDLIVTDTTSGDVEVPLPRITAQDEGKHVEVLKSVAANTVVMRPQDGQLLQGALFGNLTTRGVWCFRVAEGNWWTCV